MRTILILAGALAATPAAAETWLLKVDGYVQVMNYAHNPPKKTRFVRHTIALPMGTEAACEKAIKGGMGVRMGVRLKDTALPFWKRLAKAELSITTLAYCKRDQF